MKGLFRYIPTVIGLLSLVYLFSTGNNYSEAAYPLLQLNLYLTALVIMLPWFKDKNFGFEIRVFAPLWLSVAALIAGIEFLGGLTVILWLVWLFLPLLKIDKVLIFLKELTEDLKLQENTTKTLLIITAPPLLFVLWYHIIYGLQTFVLIAVYCIYVIATEFKETKKEVQKASGQSEG